MRTVERIMRSFRVALLGFTALGAGCGGPAPDAGGATTNGKADITDSTSITKRADGNFDVKCSDGSIEVATAQQVLANQICVPNPFDQCQGPWITQVEADALLAKGGPFGNLGRIVTVGRASIATRERTCNPTCTEWSNLAGLEDSGFVSLTEIAGDVILSQDSPVTGQCGGLTSATPECQAGQPAPSGGVTGLVTGSCFRILSDYQESDVPGHEIQRLAFGRFTVE
jgi:hypothetical protein